MKREIEFILSSEYFRAYQQSKLPWNHRLGESDLNLITKLNKELCFKLNCVLNWNQEIIYIDSHIIKYVNFVCKIYRHHVSTNYYDTNFVKYYDTAIQNLCHINKDNAF